MTEPNQKPLTDRTLARLRGYAKDNGLDPASIKVLSATEAVHSLDAQIRLLPSFKAETISSFGRLKSKDRQMQPSFRALAEEASRIKESFETGKEWIDEALAELEKDSGHGWGHDGAAVTWSNQNVVLAATENCPTCRGTAQSSCHECQGIGTVPCLYCEGLGQEPCPYCQGRGFDPSNPTKPCPNCNGQKFTPCRFCQATGKVPCPHCQGKGGTPCPDCRGTGFVTQEIKISKSAQIRFSLGRTTELPSGFLRMMDRLGETKLGQGHADISMKAGGQAEGTEDKDVVFLNAQIPYAEIRMSFAGEEAKVYIFGKKGRLSGVPAFLDKASEAQRKTLKEAAEGRADLKKALNLRIIREALGLVLGGKKTANDLRRLYPVGLSGNAAQEIMQGLFLGIKTITMRYRIMAGVGAVLASGVLFGLFLFSPVYAALSAGLNHFLFRLLEIALPLGCMGSAWFAIDQTTRKVLRQQFPTARISLAQPIGKTGYGILGAIAGLYILLFLIANA